MFFVLSVSFVLYFVNILYVKILFSQAFGLTQIFYYYRKHKSQIREPSLSTHERPKSSCKPTYNDVDPYWVLDSILVFRIDQVFFDIQNTHEHWPIDRNIDQPTVRHGIFLYPDIIRPSE